MKTKPLIALAILLSLAALSGCSDKSQPKDEPTYAPVELGDDWRTDEWIGPVTIPTGSG